MSELAELVDDRQLSPSAAADIVNDLFEQAVDGRPRLVRLSVWQAYLKDRTGHSGLRPVALAAEHVAQPDD